MLLCVVVAVGVVVAMFLRALGSFALVFVVVIVIVLVAVAVACVHGAFEQDHASPNFGIVVPE